MKIPRWLILSGTAVFAVLIALVLITGLSQAQTPDPDDSIDMASSPEAAAAVSNVIPIQGRLTDADGNPIDGTRTITFSLYASYSAITPVCQDDDSVDVDNGLFMADIHNCTSADIDGRQLYLGIQVEGDAEMTPREPIYPVPYAHSLRPGAFISATTSFPIVHVENWHESGRGFRGYAMSETGTNYGVVGASRSPDGYGGYYYNNRGGIGLIGRAMNDILGGIGLQGVSELGSGVYGLSEQGYGVYGQTNRASNNYGLFTQENLYSQNFHSLGAIMQVVQNGGDQALELGDVVAFSGMSAPLEAGGPPVIQVVGTKDANSTAVAGVVYSRFNIETVNGIDPANLLDGQEVTPDGPVAPGEYLLIVVQGPAQVKASALAGPIQPGDLLSSAGQAGYAAKAVEITFGEAEIAMPGTVLGKALEPLDDGNALIYIYVTLQ
jgi:hypothetical protein